MEKVPLPTFGFFRVALVFWAYIGVSLVLAYGAWQLVGSSPIALGVFVVAAAGLGYALLPTFRRLTPRVETR